MSSQVLTPTIAVVSTDSLFSLLLLASTTAVGDGLSTVSEDPSVVAGSEVVSLIDDVTFAVALSIQGIEANCWTVCC